MDVGPQITVFVLASFDAMRFPGPLDGRSVASRCAVSFSNSCAAGQVGACVANALLRGHFNSVDSKQISIPARMMHENTFVLVIGFVASCALLCVSNELHALFSINGWSQRAGSLRSMDDSNYESMDLIEEGPLEMTDEILGAGNFGTVWRAKFMKGDCAAKARTLTLTPHCVP